MIPVLRFDVDKTSVTRVRDRAGRIQTALPRAAKRDAAKFARIGSRELVMSASERMKPRSWKTFQGLSNPRKTDNGNSYAFYVPTYAIMLDSMKPHLAPVGGGNVLDDWVKMRRPLEPGGHYYGKGQLAVRPHPWIKQVTQAAKFAIRRAVRDAEVRKIFKK